MDVSKDYDCLLHDLIMAKLGAYGFDKNSLGFLFDYMSCRKQRTKMRSAYRIWAGVLRGISQGLILGLLIFNIFINNTCLFIKKEEIWNFIDANTLYSCDRNLLRIKENLIFGFI